MDGIPSRTEVLVKTTSADPTFREPLSEDRAEAGTKLSALCRKKGSRHVSALPRPT